MLSFLESGQNELGIYVEILLDGVLVRLSHLQHKSFDCNMDGVQYEHFYISEHTHEACSYGWQDSGDDNIYPFTWMKRSALCRFPFCHRLSECLVNNLIRRCSFQRRHPKSCGCRTDWRGCR